MNIFAVASIVNIVVLLIQILMPFAFIWLIYKINKMDKILKEIINSFAVNINGDE